VVALLTFFVVLVISLVVVRIASVALTLTGMPSEIARFQARSAWTGTGYTTREAEDVVRHPVRRRIVSWLMLLRGVGVVTVVATLMLSFAATDEQEQRLQRLAMLLGGIVLIWMIFTNAWVDRKLSRLILRALSRYTDIPVRDYGELLHLSEDYIVSEMLVRRGDWLADRPLADLRLPDEGLLVLGVQCADGRFIGAPRGGTHINEGDTVILYGRAVLIASIDQRPASPEGDQAHEESVVQEAPLLEEEKAPEAERPL
jgi:type III secretory pathway component EscS